MKRWRILVLAALLCAVLTLPGAVQAAAPTCPGRAYTCIRICKMCVNRVGLRVAVRWCDCYVAGCVGRAVFHALPGR
jgi:hypothetical protein